MHLVEPLAAGIQGARTSDVSPATPGNAIIFKRGTTTRAAYFTDFEGQGTSSTATITLDSNGAAVVYVDEFVTVEVRDGAGTLIRTFTAVTKDSATEVQSTAFTGTSYEDATGSTTTGVNQPTILKSVLDLWITNSGAKDWKWLDADGTTERTIQDGLRSTYRMIYNVKDPEFGAKGDGTTDDRGAINAAIVQASADGGGVVYMPFGTYRVTDSISLLGNVSLWGSGTLSTSISIDDSSNGTLVGAASTLIPAQDIRGITFGALQANTGTVVSMPVTSNARISDCFFGSGSSNNGTLVDSTTATAIGGSLTLTDCFFQIRENTQTAVNADGDADIRVDIVRCVVRMPTTYNGSAIQVQNAYIDGCRFFGSDVAAGTFDCIQIAGGSDSRVMNCHFDDVGGDTMTQIDITGLTSSGGRLYESGNSYSALSQVYKFNSTDDQEQVTLWSRATAQISISDNSSVITLDGTTFPRSTDFEGFFIIRASSGTNLVVNADAKVPLGHDLTVSIHNNDGALSETVTFTSNFSDDASPHTLNIDKVTVFRFKGLLAAGGTDVKWYAVGTPTETSE